MAFVKFLFFLFPSISWAVDLVWHSKISFPGDQKFQESLFGGISGLAFDEKTQTLIALSDDRGEHGEPRLYEFSFENIVGTPQLKFKRIVFLKAPQKRVDFEAITLLQNGNLLISSEGDQNFKPRVPPEILEMTREGEFVRSWDVPADWLPNAAGKLEKGVSNNRGIEAMAWSPDQKWLFVSPESPLVQTRPKIPAQIFQDGKSLAQCEYELNEANAGFGHGISEALWFSSREVWVLERSIKKSLEAVADLYSFVIDEKGQCGPRTKIFDLAKNSSKLVNLEGMTWGPVIKPGFRTLIVVSDNNFVLNLPTEFYLYFVK